MKSIPTHTKLNHLSLEDYPIHDWYRFVLSFPPHLVRHYLQEFGATPTNPVLDPFCGTGTTLVECKKLGIPSVGIEANTMTYFASEVKVDWSPDPQSLIDTTSQIVGQVRLELETQGINDDGNLSFVNLNGQLTTLSDEVWKVMLKDSISPLPLHKSLLLIEYLNRYTNTEGVDHIRLALAKTLVNSISNLHFAPEVSVGEKKQDAPVLVPWLKNVRIMASDLRLFKSQSDVPALVHHGDARQILDFVEPNSVDIVITSPPYPNEKDYTRITRLESVLLGFIQNKHDLRALKRHLVRSNTRNVYVGDDDDSWIAQNEQVQQLANEIETKRVRLGKDSGFEKLYGRVTKLYFGGMARHLSELRQVLRPGARLAYVVGDQASYLQVMIRTGQILGEIARSLGYELVNIDLFRTRTATATREQLREEVVILRWLG